MRPENGRQIRLRRECFFLPQVPAVKIGLCDTPKLRSKLVMVACFKRVRSFEGEEGLMGHRAQAGSAVGPGLVPYGRGG